MTAAERLGCRVLPFGAGAQGMTARAVTWLARTKPRAFCATPSYALRLAEAAGQEKIDPREFGLEIMFFSGEPGASAPKVRDAIANAFGARVVDCGTMAEMTPFMSASATAGTRDGMLLWQDMVWHEVCDRAENRAARPDIPGRLGGCWSALRGRRGWCSTAPSPVNAGYRTLTPDCFR
jgi:phenylacetate-coenzyme A ligase PaaK-like adenylate-forming protein